MGPEPGTLTNVMLHDICTQNPYGPKRFFFDQGENGTLIAKNLDYDRMVAITSKSYYSTFYDQQQQAMSGGNSRVCSVELTTCPACSIQVHLKILNLPACEISPNVTSANRCSGCDHLVIKENFYSTPRLICGKSARTVHDPRTQENYRSVGRTLTISFSFSRNYEYAFLLEFASVVNTRTISARSGEGGYISSPHFPAVYPQDYSNEIKLQNLDFVNGTTSNTGCIMLIFDDYALGLSSFIEISDSNEVRQYALGSSLFRPPVVLIQSYRMAIRFFANGGRASGYRASYRFINESADLIEIPITDCGGLVDDFGGVITMYNMSSPNAARLYDCIWLIKPLPTYQQNTKSHLFVRVEQLSSLERGTSLDIRQGLISLSPLIESLTTTVSPQSLTSEYLVPADVGFYIRLRGRLNNEFKMAIAYAAFSYTECFAIKDFVCLNHRCISSDLRCDGFNHCGDDSDEQTSCSDKAISPQDPIWWMTHTPKYYFPKLNDYGDFGATSFVLLVATLVLFIASILALLYRMSSHSQLMRERQARLDFIRSQIINNPDEREVEIENPPSYEAPPDYAEIAKIAQMEKESEISYTNGRVLVISTPTPGNKRRRELMRQSRNQLGSGDLLSATPTSSRSSTPARSRNSTPQRNRVRRTPVQILTPVHINHLQAIDSFIPNSPPPPYEINLDSPFHIVRLVEDGQAIPPNESSDDPNIEVATETPLPVKESDCGCPGACGCGPPSLNYSMDSTAPLLRSLSFTSIHGADFEVEQPPPAPIENPSDKNEKEQLPYPDGSFNEAINHRLARSFLSVDRSRHQALGKTKKMPWNKSF
ncbi:uncharacterized protein LOC124192074 isoform X2 [Daphnia pulex]|uniref:uncharacterized protein LOC124192074 isoform X2 n=1 Tax=Daphnia pulex TaxID=6669 RepID=UPI001EDCD9CC|nr:uncharacterized protein LOC124192074 isoform X2 [Daphnia pulex]